MLKRSKEIVAIECKDIIIEEKNGMKKKLSVFVCLLMVLTCLALTACGGKQNLSNSKYLGTWKAANITMGEESEDFEDEILLTLNGDGTAEMTSADEVTKCTWEETGKGFKLKGDAKMSFSEEEGGVKASILGVEIHFMKQ